MRSFDGDWEEDKDRIAMKKNEEKLFGRDDERSAEKRRSESVEKRVEKQQWGC